CRTGWISSRSTRRWRSWRRRIGTRSSSFLEGPVSDELERRTVSKVSWRLLPYLFLLYVIAYIDRINTGVAALQMPRDVPMDAAMFGRGAGLFFVGYFLFEVPSNLILARVGARVWITRIMAVWGVISSCMMFATSVWSFYLMRFLLGAAEAGF